ncbi:hypothetical protein QBC39DRAFT_339286 [Podospora conica]|nr:hypothetical protein QBC39DRAFT_339286 [Schizothecium conicum]
MRLDIFQHTYPAGSGPAASRLREKATAGGPRPGACKPTRGGGTIHTFLSVVVFWHTLTALIYLPRPPSFSRRLVGCKWATTNTSTHLSFVLSRLLPLSFDCLRSAKDPDATTEYAHPSIHLQVSSSATAAAAGRPAGQTDCMDDGSILLRAAVVPIGKPRAVFSPLTSDIVVKIGPPAWSCPDVGCWRLLPRPAATGRHGGG